MDQLAALWNWIASHPAESAWAVFGALTALVGIYRLNEVKIKAYVAKTPTRADDKLVSGLDAVVAVFEVLRQLVPYGVARPAKEKRDA